ncbi:MAG TPA: hypothetical protein VF133_00870 [Terriglobales bacterium]
MKRLSHLLVAMLLLSAAAALRAQDDDVSLGDLARNMRKAKPANEVVIDNDNLPIMMDKAQAERLEGKPIFSIDPSGKAFRMTSPDGSCSLSFDARATALISTPFVATNLPQDELQKIDGEATVHDGRLQVSLHNGTNWELKEIVVAVTILEQPMGATLQAATLSLPAEIAPPNRSPDTTFLYHLKPAAAGEAAGVFEGNLGDDLAQVKNWHWALVGARGIPPAAPGSIAQAAPGATPALVAPLASPAAAVPTTGTPPTAVPLTKSQSAEPPQNAPF